MDDLVSIIVPVYKVEKYLRECLDSIIVQTYRNLEIIVVDDGSPDGCPAICDEYAERDPRVKIVHKSNGGLSDARNKGLDIAIGNYITFIDSDDFVHETYVECLYKALKENNAGVSVCQMQTFQKNSDIVAEFGSHESYELSGENAVVDLYKRMSGIKLEKAFGVGVTAWGKMYDKHLFDTIRFPYGKIHEDDATVPLLLYYSKNVSVISSKLYYYRKTENSIVNSEFSIKRYDRIEGTELCSTFFKERKEKSLYEIALLRKKRLVCWYAYLAKKNGLYDFIPEKYRIKTPSDIIFLKKFMRFSWKETLAFVFPKLYQRYLARKG